MGEMELEFVKEAFETNWIAPVGPHVDAFEKEFAALISKKKEFTRQDLHDGQDKKYSNNFVNPVNDVKKYAVALSSGTAALHLALILLGVQKGDEVICSALTFSASANPIIYQGATPVFVDSESGSWNMDVDCLKTAIFDRIKKGKDQKL